MFHVTSVEQESRLLKEKNTTAVISSATMTFARIVRSLKLTDLLLEGYLSRACKAIKLDFSQLGV